MTILLLDCQNATEYEEARKPQNAMRVVVRRLRRDGRYAQYAKIDRNGSHRRNDPTAQRSSPTEEPQIKIVYLRASIPGKKKFISICLVAGYLVAKLRTPRTVVATAVEKRAQGMSFQRIASIIGLDPRTVATCFRRLERAKARLTRRHAKGAFAKAARGSMKAFFRALDRANVLVLSKLLADGIVI